MKSSFLGFAGFLLVALMLTNSLVWADQLTQVVTFSSNNLKFEKVSDYDLVSLKGFTSLAEIGKPGLPVRSFSIVIPTGGRVTGVEVVSTQQEVIPGNFFIFPGQKARPYNLIGSIEQLIEPDPVVYGSDQAYPENILEFVRQADLAGQELVILRICPLQYIPAQKTLILNKRIEIAVNYSMDGSQPAPINQMSEMTMMIYEDMMKGMVLNPEAIKIGPMSMGHDTAQDTVILPHIKDHVIITSNALKPSFNNLLNWHKKKGLPDTVITTEYIYSHYSGGSAEEQIRNFIIYAHQHWGAIWFLLGGDVNVVPVANRFFWYWDVPGDMYYGDFDDDWICEVFVGRASVDNASEVNVFTDKVLTYEKNPPMNGYPTKALLMGFDADYLTPDEVMKECVDNYYIPDNFTVTKVYDSYTGNHETACFNFLNEGQNLVNHADHGNYDFMGTGWVNHAMGFYNSDMDALTNGDALSIIYSLACDVNGFDYQTECIAEHLVHNPNGGAVAFVGNTRYGWYYEGEPYSLSNFYDMEWWNSLFSFNKYHLGQTLADSKNRNPPNGPGGGPENEYIVWELSLLGEPEMPIWTAVPSILEVTYPISVQVGYQQFVVTVNKDGNPLPNALVCVWKGSEVYKHGLTDSNGQKIFTINPQTVGSLDVTVTAQNCLPYEGTSVVSFPLAKALH